jgi:tRNA 2-thiocytidine biosynthesis protein TtcA
VRFEVGAVTVDPRIEGFDPSPLKPYLAGLGVPYAYEEQPILDQALRHMRNPSFCSFCARMKRGVMYRVAREQGWNVLALGQHLDDLAESFLMSAFYEGRLQTMKAHYRVRAGDLRVVRPLAYARERQLADFAQTAGLPVVPDSCPACFRAPSEREHVAALLAGEERARPALFRNLLAAMRPLMVAGAAGTSSSTEGGGGRAGDPSLDLAGAEHQGVTHLEVGEEQLDHQTPAQLQAEEQQDPPGDDPGTGAPAEPAGRLR